jgi:pyridoxal phosphate enzyme (YggS family)
MIMTSLIEAIKTIYRRMSSAAIRSGRDPYEIKLVAVTKNVGVDRILEAVEWGLRIFGENRVQEADQKISNLKSHDSRIEWHMIGHLQKNKAKTAVRLFDVIHSLDSAGLASELNACAEKEGRIQQVLIQVKLSAEESKHGVSRDNLADLLKTVSGMKHLNLRGLMTIPPYYEDPENTRPYFRELRKLRDDAEKQGYRLPELSMGMTHDYEIAILEGATMVRIGTSIFVERDKEET